MTGVHFKRTFEADMLANRAAQGWRVGYRTIPHGTPAHDHWLYTDDRAQAQYPIDVISQLRETQPVEIRQGTERLQDPDDRTGPVLTHHRIRQRGKLDGIPVGSEGEGLSPTQAAGSGAGTPVRTTLQALVDQLNGLFEGQLSEADLLSYATYVSGKMLENPVLAQQAGASTKDRFLHGAFRKEMIKAVIESLEGHKSMSEQVLGRTDVQEGFATILLNLVYEGFRKQREGEA